MKNKEKQLREKYLLLIYDLYYLKYKKGGKQWYELTDYIRDNMIREGLVVECNDKEKSVQVFSSANADFPIDIDIKIKNDKII